MNLSVKRNINIYDMIYFFILSLALLSGYFDGGPAGFAWAPLLWNSGIIVMLVALLFRKVDIKTAKLVIVGTGFFTFLGGINYAMGIDRGYAISNLLSIMKVTLVLISIMLFARNCKSNYFERLKKSFWLFNVFAVLNMVVLTIQINVKGFMMPSAWLSMGAYVDLCAGLFGFNGTHILGIFMIFVFIYNQYIADFVTPKKNKMKLIIYNIIILIWNFILSTQNDNVAIFILTAFFYITYLFLNSYWEKVSFSTKILKWIKYILPFIFVVVMVFAVTPIRDFVLDIVLQRIVSFFDVTPGSTGSGSTERIGIILYSFANEFGFLMGKGIGYYAFRGVDMYGNLNVGFLQFGISSMSSMIYLLGIWFYGFIVLWFSKMYYNLTKANSKMLFIIILLTVVLFTFYTTNLTSTPITVCLMLIFSVFGMTNESIKKRLSKRNFIQ